jgi:hypothetical protein
VKRYIVTEEQLEQLREAASEHTFQTQVGSFQDFLKAAEAVKSISIQCRAVEVPEWATHFVAKLYPSATASAINLWEEIPK